MTNDILKNKGFTLVECLVAVSIFTLSILGLLVLLGGNLVNSNYIKNKMIATYLSQEGIEYMRNLRDTYVLFDSGGPSAGWTAFTQRLASSGCSGVNGCYFDDQSITNYSDPNQPIVNIMSVSPCANSSCSNAPLLYNSTTARYNYIAGGTATPFVRVIKLLSSSSTEVSISSIVRWSQPSGTYTTTFSENLTNWVE